MEILIAGKWHCSISDKQVKTIFYKASSLERAVDYICFRRTSVQYLYSRMIDIWASTNGMPFLFPLDHDNFLKPDKYPFYFRLQNNWKIRQEDLKFLKNGPLFSEDGTHVLVTEAISKLTFFKAIWNYAAPILTWLVPSGFIYRIFLH